ncbi:MBL fold metallo-hydrolase [Pseudarthrobacter sp. J1738]|uniref:MBL fold metallo-hydrolase n=1 Tax=Pseudarthrobacter sp. J1738 TaxID=3420446 RepID=UPI003D288482
MSTRREFQQSSQLTAFSLAPNPGPMSLDGTNSYVISAPRSAQCVVVDPGPADEDHLKGLASAGEVELILITHRHADHTAGALRLHELTGAPVRAGDRTHCYAAEPLQGGEEIRAAGVEIRVLATPGHTADSLCFYLPEDGANGSVLTGDTILGKGTTVLDFPDGTLSDYLRSLDVLEALGAATVLPAHGPVLFAVDVVAREYRNHRHQRLDQVRDALAVLGEQAPSEAVARKVYHDVDPSVWRAALLSVEAQLAYLRG